MIKIIRYSVSGFRPQKQTHHIHGFEYWDSFNPYGKDIPEHLRYTMEEIKKEKLRFYSEHFDDLQEGLWFFIDGHKNRQALNHLSKPVPCWEGEVRENLVVYDCNLEHIVPITDSIVQGFGCYIPKRLIGEIKNIKRRKRA